MLLFLGSFQIVPVLVVLLAAVGGALLASLAGATLGLVLANRDVILAALVLVALAGLTASEALAWGLARRRDPRWFLTLRALAASRRVDPARVGAKSYRLAELIRRGLPVPDGLVLTLDLCRRLRERAPRLQGPELWAALPLGVGGRLRRAVRSLGADRVVVRSSFPGEDGARLHAGVFESVRDVDARDPGALFAAVGRVLASACGPAAQAYRRRHGLPESDEAAVLVQAQVPATHLGLLASRSIDGRGDRLPLELRTANGISEGSIYDLLDRALLALDRSSAEPAPTWLPRLADQVLGLDHLLGGPVHVEFAEVDGRVWFLQVRPFPAVDDRVTWINSGPVELDRAPIPDRIDRARGGTNARRLALNEGLRAAGLDAPVRPSELQRFDGATYLDLAAWRRVLATSLERPGARALWRQARLLLRVPATRRTPSAPGASSALLAQARVLAALGLIGGLLERLDANDSPLGAALRRTLRRRRGRLAAERERLGRELEAEERACLASSAPAPETTCSTEPLPTRRFEPELDGSVDPTPAASGHTRFAGQPIAPGVVEAPLFRIEAVRAPPDDTPPVPCVLILPHGGPEHLARALTAAGVVLASGGVLSHVAVGLREAGIPSLVCTDPRLRDLAEGLRGRLDGARGTLDVREVPP